MKATGIVRRMDDLGRVVIPKEIRRSMRLKEGDPLELYTTHDGCVCFKKYHPLGDIDWDLGKRLVGAVIKQGFAIYDIDGNRVAYRAAHTAPKQLDTDDELPSAVRLISGNGEQYGYIYLENQNEDWATAVDVLCAFVGE